MEETPVVVAHSYARRAAEETAKARLAAAGTEHDNAAESYLRASENTSDIEALRILKLLEDHHHKLAQIVKAKNEYSKRTAGRTEIEDADREDVELQKDVLAHGTLKTPQPEKLSAPTLPKSRDAPSSLAKDIASRRGIPQSQQRRNPTAATNVSPVQATGRMSGTPVRGGQSDRKQEKSTASEILASQGSTSQSHTAEIPAADEGFTRFYSNLTSGPLSKLSSMLAFAGLPLAETQQEDSPTSSKTEKTSARVSTGPDVDQLFSKAALKALEEQKRHPGNAFGPGESFYVIPTSGGTASYANILTKAQQEGLRSQAAIKGDESDEFVDAKEVMTDSDRRVKKAQDPPSSSLREEELQIENAALKQILDKLSHRLQAFESHAQDASMAALAQSMASVRPAAAAAVGRSDHDRDERMRAMETQLEREMREREKLGLENQKQKQVIAKYRSHWEQLKDSARAREKAKREKAESAG